MKRQIPRMESLRKATSLVVTVIALAFLVASQALTQTPTDSENYQGLFQELKSSGRIEQEELYERIALNRGEMLPLVHSALEDPDVGIRLSALKIIELLRDKTASEYLLDMARTDQDDLVRVRSVVVLSQVGGSTYSAPILKLLDTCESEELCSAVLYSLGRVGSEASIPRISSWLIDARSFVRLQAAASLARLGSTLGEPLLLTAAESGSSLERKHAIDALGFLESKESAKLAGELSLTGGVWSARAQVALSQRYLRSLPKSEKEDFLLSKLQSINRLEAEWAFDTLLSEPDGDALLLKFSRQTGLSFNAASSLKLKGV